MKKPVLFSYCLRYDAGSAPNPFWDICTLAICKPVIRRNAEIGDWVIGTGSKEFKKRDITDCLVYAMKIDNIMTLEEYDFFCKEKKKEKIPDMTNSDYKRRVGDCIYSYSSSKLSPILRRSVHNELNKKTDLTGKNVLISSNFYYFGKKPKELIENLLKIIKKGPGHKKITDDKLINEFIEWISHFDKGINSEPQIIINLDFDLSTCTTRDLNESEEDETIARNCS